MCIFDAQLGDIFGINILDGEQRELTGATGNTGSVVANRLLDQGKKVRVIGRSMERLQPFVARGAEAILILGDLTVALGIDAVVAEAKKGKIPVISMMPDMVPRGAMFAARVCDDLAGVAAMVCVLEELIAKKIDGHVIALFSRAEEVGFAGVA